ncbi:hypothetical protein [Vibrio splendidus]|uniref:hypothetical protein n=1 Tax=Vibrio splendidus TaxID=29497 RepID=UPI000CA7627C|nr:hypothetical protein [Vibrio splendidus]PMG60791.1 hypothetical protein BCU89_26030 [Vibrio splendidus]
MSPSIFFVSLSIYITATLFTYLKYKKASDELNNVQEEHDKKQVNDPENYYGLGATEAQEMDRRKASFLLTFFLGGIFVACLAYLLLQKT